MTTSSSPVLGFNSVDVVEDIEVAETISLVADVYLEARANDPTLTDVIGDKSS
jgi:hypothetical protein